MRKGAKVWGWEGEAFGSTPPNEDPDGDGRKIIINLRQDGAYWDAESSLMLNSDRYYDSRSGRFITSDRRSVAAHVRRWYADLNLIGQPPLEINSYARVANNPWRWVDSTGFATTAPEFGPSPYNPPQDVGGGDDSSLAQFGAKMIGAIVGAPVLVGAVGTIGTTASDLAIGGARVCGIVIAKNKDKIQKACTALGLGAAICRNDPPDEFLEHMRSMEQARRSSEIARQTTSSGRR